MWPGLPLMASQPFHKSIEPLLNIEVAVKSYSYNPEDMDTCIVQTCQVHQPAF